MAGDGGGRLALGICATILLAGAVSLAEPVLAPVAFALLVVALAWPVQRGLLQARVPAILALLVTVAVTLVVLVVLALAAGWGFGRVARWVIANAGQLQMLYAQQLEWLEARGIAAAGLVRVRQPLAGADRPGGAGAAAGRRRLPRRDAGLRHPRPAGSRRRGAAAGAHRARQAGGGPPAAGLHRDSVEAAHLHGRAHHHEHRHRHRGLGLRPRHGAGPRAGMGRDRLRAELHPLHRLAVGDAVPDHLRGAAIRHLASGGLRLPGAAGHPVPLGQHDRAAAGRRAAGHVALPGAGRGLPRGVPVGHPRRLHRRAGADRGADPVRAIPRQPLGWRNCCRGRSPR